MPILHVNYSVALTAVVFMKLKERLLSLYELVRQNGMPVLCGIIALRAQEIVTLLNIKWQEFKASRRCNLYE
jgi:hypothetical protein